jgi:hypothetical protein
MGTIADLDGNGERIMDKTLEIENIEALRRSVGIDDVELRGAIRQLRVGDLVNLTLLASDMPAAGETLSVRVADRLQSGPYSLHTEWTVLP